MPLDNDAVQALLKKEVSKNVRSPGRDGVAKFFPRPKQIGPLKYFEQSSPCASRGCAVQCHVKVRGVPYCTTHALYVLNEIILRELEHIDLSVCECDAGKFSKGNIHTYNCPIVDILDQPKELLDELL